MNLDPILTKAARLLRRGKYDNAIKILEPEVNRYHGVFSYYYILALSYLYTRVFSVAFTYFKLARDVKIRDPSVLLGLAVLYLRRGETDRAVDFYLEVQEQDEHNKIAKRALGVIRKYSGTEALSAWIESRKLSTLFPPFLPVPLSRGRIFLPIITALVVIALGLGVLIKIRVIPMPIASPPRAEREGLLVSALEQGEQEEPVQIDGGYRYVLTRKQVFDTYSDARNLFTKYRDEAAKVALNRLIESNASEAIKAKAKLLISYMETPGFDTLKDRFAYGEVLKEPILYRNCYVIWRGMATNLEVLQNTTSFDFLVGYDTRSVLQGIVPVIFDSSVPVNIEQPLEILGRIVPVPPEKGMIRLEGVALHQAPLGKGK